MVPYTYCCSRSPRKQTSKTAALPCSMFGQAGQSKIHQYRNKTVAHGRPQFQTRPNTQQQQEIGGSSKRYAAAAASDKQQAATRRHDKPNKEIGRTAAAAAATAAAVLRCTKNTEHESPAPCRWPPCLGSSAFCIKKKAHVSRGGEGAIVRP